MYSRRPAGRTGHPRSSVVSGRARRKRNRCVHLEFLEDRCLLSAGLWQAQLDGLSGMTSDEQVQAVQQLLASAQIAPQDVQVVAQLGVDGLVEIQTPVDTTEDVLEQELQALPGFVSVAPFDDGDDSPSTADTGSAAAAVQDTSDTPAPVPDLADGYQPAFTAFNPDGSDTPLATAGPTANSPTQLRNAYGFSQISFAGGTVPADGSGTTIAIVDAYDDPNIASDLHQFDLEYGLPDPVFTKVNQTGGSTPPAPNTSWSTEISIDVEWAHAIAPGANILLVEANSNSTADLNTAAEFAATQPGVVAVSMSFLGAESSSEVARNSDFVTPPGHPGVTFVAASGDNGAPPSQPAIDPNVLAVGGTSINLDAAGNILSEVGWTGSGGGISAFEPQPSYQTGVVTQSTTQRTNPDVAYDANPNTGITIYDTYNFPTPTPWGQFGGTSIAAPQWAALIAIADQGRAQAGLGSLDGPSQTLPRLYALPASDFNDITAGTSTGNPEYSAGPGYDLVTGRGSPQANQIVPALMGLDVTGSTPAAGSVVFTAPTSYAITFSYPIDPASLSASDLEVNSIAASGVTLSGNDMTATFTFNTSPVVSFGPQTMSIAANSLYVLGEPNLVNQAAFNATFYYDDVLLQVTSTNPAPGSVVATVPTTFTYDVTFNKPLEPSSVTTSSLLLSGITGATVTGATLLSGNMTAQFTISAPTAGTLSISIPVGAIDDSYGDPGALFSANYFLDLPSPSPFPTPLTQTAPAGSLIYSGTVTGEIEPVGHNDTLTLNVDPSQTITVLVTPTGTSLQPTVQLSDPTSAVLGSATAAAAGSDASLQTIATTIGGTYTITVGGSAGTTGSYTVEVVLNAALESESIGGPSNANTAQDLSGSFTSLGGSSTRGAVVGTISGSSDSRDLYSVNLAAGSTATVALTSTSGGSVDMRLLNGVPSTTRIWDGGSTTSDGNWMTPSNWVGNIAPVAGDDLVFPAGAGLLTSTDNNFPAGTAFNSITISGIGYDLYGNSLTLNSGMTLATTTSGDTIEVPIVLGGNVTFLSTYLTSGSLFLSGTINTNGQTLTVDGTGNTFLTGVISGAGSLVKNGPGTLELENTNDYTGPTTVNAGFLEITASQALGATSAAVAVNSGATLLLAGSITVANPLTLNGGGINDNPTVAAGALTNTTSATWSGTIALNSNAAMGAVAGTTLTIGGTENLRGNTLTVNSAGTVALNGVIGVGGGPGSLVVNATLTTGTVIIGAADGFTGTTTVDAGTLTLSGSGSSASTSYTVNQNATLSLNLNNGTTNNPSRVPATAAIALMGGTLAFVGNNTASVASSQTVGTVTLAGGYSTISSAVGTGGSDTSALTITALVRDATATVNFSGTGLGTSTNEVLITTPLTLVGTAPGILPYATVNATDFATIVSGAITAYANYTSLAMAVAGSVVKLTAAPTLTVSTPALAGLVLNGFSTLTLNAGVTLNTGALLAAGATSTTITGGTLNLAGTTVTPGEGIVETDDPTLTISSPLLSTDSLVAAGSGTLSLTASESYTAGTTLDSGTLMVVSGALGSGALALVGGSLTATASGTAVLSNALTLNNANTIITGPSQITFSGTATLTGVNTLNVTLTSNVAFFTGKWTGSGSLDKIGFQSWELSPSVASTFTGGIVATGGFLDIGTVNSALGTGPLTLVGGDVQTFVTAGVSVANPVIFNGGSVTMAGTPNMTFTGPVSLTGITTLTTTNTGLTTFAGPISGTGALTRTSTGTLVLSGVNSETGAITNDGTGGTLQINGTNTSGPVGVILGTLAGTGTLGAISAGANSGAASGTDNPGTSIPGTQQVASADFSNGGDLTIQIGGYGTAGVNYDQLDVTGALALGGTSTLTLDLNGLTTAGTATGIVLFGSLTGAVPLFNQIAVINNPNNFSVIVTYNASSIDVTVVSGTPAPTVTPTTEIWTGCSAQRQLEQPRQLGQRLGAGGRRQPRLPRRARASCRQPTISPPEPASTRSRSAGAATALPDPAIR